MKTKANITIWGRIIVIVYNLHSYKLKHKIVHNSLQTELLKLVETKE